MWETLDQPETWEAIGGVDRIFEPRLDTEGRLLGFSFDTVAAGKRYVGTATPHRREEGQVMAWNVENSEVTGVTTVELTPSETGTAITVTLDVQSAGLLSGMFFSVIAKAIGNGFPAAVDAFAAGFAD